MNEEHVRHPSARDGEGFVRRLSNLLGLRLPGGKARRVVDRQCYDEGVFLGKSPTIQDIEMLARRAGFRALLNLNTEGESEEILSPNVEATWAHAFEMEHVRVSTDVRALRSEGIDRFFDALQRIAKPVYVHSLHGRRASALITIHLAQAHRLSGSEALAEAKNLGIDCVSEQLQRFTVFEADRRIQARVATPASGLAESTTVGHVESEGGSPAGSGKGPRKA